MSKYSQPTRWTIAPVLLWAERYAWVISRAQVLTPAWRRGGITEEFKDAPIARRSCGAARVVELFTS